MLLRRQMTRPLLPVFTAPNGRSAPVLQNHAIPLAAARSRSICGTDRQGNPSIVFTHTPRTGGSSLHAAFLRAYDRKHWVVVDSPVSLPSRRDQITEAKADGVYVGGHFTLRDVHAHTGLDTTTTVNISTVRDPVERAVSLYAFMRKNPDVFPEITRATAGRGFGFYIDHLTECAPALLVNAQCYHLCGEQSFAAATLAVSRNYTIIGDISSLRDLVGAVATRFRGSWKARRPALPRKAENTAFAEWRKQRVPEVEGLVSSACRARLEPLVEEDRRLYEWIVREHDGLYGAERGELARLLRWLSGRGRQMERSDMGA